MKTFIAFAIAAVLVQGALAQSRNPRAAGLGNFKSGGKQTVASAKDLDRAEKLAAQARARVGADKKGSGWAHGGSGSSGRSGSR